MACACGRQFTVCLADDGRLHTFGTVGRLGRRHVNEVSYPRPIPDLPKITQVSCGEDFTVCVDEEGCIWSFGKNKFGQLGLKDIPVAGKPIKIEEIPPIQSVSCGFAHTIVITTDLNLWSFGGNGFAQLFLDNKENQRSPQQTSMSNILKITTGSYHSLCQTMQGEIYSCGRNSYGELGIGKINYYNLPSPILNQPDNIIQFCSGFSHTLFLDSEGNVFSVGFNTYGSLGLGFNVNQTTLKQIPNIPPIQIISCCGYSSYLLDFDGNVWSFGLDVAGQLGHGHKLNRNMPKKIDGLKNICKISYGSCGYHFLAKDYNNNIFGMGENYNNQLLPKSTDLFLKPKKLNSKYFSIWGEPNTISFSRHKSARK